MRAFRDGIGLAYEEAGSGNTPILLVHGWATDRSVLRPLFEALKSSYRVVSVDLRGFGQSDAPDHRYTIQGYADDLVFLARELELEKSVVVGHSMGGMVALDFAARYPRETAAAVILEAMVVASEPVLVGLRTMLQRVRQPAYREFLAGLFTFLTGPNFEPLERARVVALCSACPQHVLVSALEAIIEFDSVAVAGEVKCPLLYVGTNTTYADVERFRELCPQLVTGQLVGCGHYFPLEVPEQLAPMVSRFIRTSLTPAA